jgi:hypothetical protein
MNHEYVQIHEVCREKKADGNPQYEAIVDVAWDERRHAYPASGWIRPKRRTFADWSSPMPSRNRTKCVYFQIARRDTFHNTFSYDKKTDTCECSDGTILYDAAHFDAVPKQQQPNESGS